MSFDDKRQAAAKEYLNRFDGVQTSVSRSDGRYWDDDMKEALGIGGFPLEITLNRIGKKEVPAVLFNENAVCRSNEEIKIFVTPNQYFGAKFRGIFIEMKTQHSSGAESKDGSRGRISQYGAQRQAVEYLVKFSIRFQNR